MTNGSKNPKSFYGILTQFRSFTMREKIHLCNNFSWVVYIFHLYIFALICCIILFKKFACLTMVPMETGKRHILSHTSNDYKEEKMLHQKHESYRFELPLKKIVSWLEKCYSTKNVAISKILGKKAQKFKNIIFLHFTTTFHNFALNIETGWPLGCLNPFWKLEMSMMYVSVKDYFS